MKKTIRAVFLSLLIPSAAFAHQPRIPQGTQIAVPDPDISKAYYSQLNGRPHTYTIISDKPFELYVNILVPDLAGQKKDLTVIIIRDGNSANPLAVMDGKIFAWAKFFEEFGHDTYWRGPEYKARAGAGKYDIIVSNPGNEGKYSLAIGEKELFDFKETISALTLIPKIKRGFFEESPANFILSPLGWGLTLLMYLLALGSCFIIRLAIKISGRAPACPLTKLPIAWLRLILYAAGAGLFARAITTNWSPLLLFLSGLTVCGAVFSGSRNINK